LNELTCSPAADSSTQILIGAGTRDQIPARIAAMGEGRSIVALVDRCLPAEGVVPEGWLTLRLRGGEECKTFATLEEVLRQMVGWQLDRRTILVAIGGGTIGDLGGLAASLFLRGIELVQMPTTLLAMLDSSVGGKTAINVPEGKNLVGTYWPPKLMVADVEMLATLPQEHLLSGLGEALKMGIGFDRDLFALLEKERDGILARDPALLTEVVTMAVRNKIETVESDPLETTGRRRCLNLGHTLAHALEAASGFTMLHGAAVAQGLHFALSIAAGRGVMGAADIQRCRALLEAYGFRRDPIPDAPTLLEYFQRDKKMERGLLHFILPTGIGSCRAEGMRVEELLAPH
jgi:3-dehydroquinate synthase